MAEGLRYRVNRYMDSLRGTVNGNPSQSGSIQSSQITTDPVPSRLYLLPLVGVTLFMMTCCYYYPYISYTGACISALAYLGYYCRWTLLSWACYLLTLVEEYAMQNEVDDNQSFKIMLLKTSKEVIRGTPSVYELKLTESISDETKMLRTCVIEGESHASPEGEKVIMVVGATGAGKTTLINGMVNYVLGVDWQDEFRFKLVVDRDEAAQTQQRAMSQTKWITAYRLRYHTSLKVPYTVTIIDTPGFGDTGGIDRDKKTVDKIRNFFHSGGDNDITYINAIGFVVQASNPRLTHTQQFIFDSVLMLFGKDVIENIFLMITFCDGQEPPVLTAIEEAGIPYTESFKFNNSALFADNQKKNDKRPSFDSMFWDLGSSSFEKYFSELGATENISLKLTRDVLEERKHLEVVVEGIHRQLQNGLGNLETLKNEIEIFKRHETEIALNQNFEFEVEVDKAVQKDLPSGMHTTTCLTCNYTCHLNCKIPADDEKSRCSAMVDGDCIICTNKCRWNMHRNMPYQIVFEKKKIKQTAQEVKERYLEAKDGEANVERVIEQLTQNFYMVQVDIIELSEKIRQSLERLGEIALKPMSMSTLDYIDLLIKTEQQKGEEGWQGRVDQLFQARKRTEIIQKHYNEELESPVAELEETESVISDKTKTSRLNFVLEKVKEDSGYNKLRRKIKRNRKSKAMETTIL